MNFVSPNENGQACSMCYVNFNQDFSSLTAGTKAGYSLYSLGSVNESLDEVYVCENKDIFLVERLFSSSLLAVVSFSNPTKLMIFHYKKEKEICTYTYTSNILAVRLNRLRLVVCLEDSLYIHNIRDMKVLHRIRDTPLNTHGIFALSPNNDNCFLAYPGSNQTGEVQVFDAVNLRAVSTLDAHDSPVAAMAFNLQGNWIATASGKGTVIRVFSIPEGQRIYEFRRGMKRCVTIYSLSFSSDSAYLCCSSNTETVHIFKLDAEKSKLSGETTQQGWIDYAIKTSTSYLPTQVTEMLSQERDFAYAHLPIAGLRNICAITFINQLPYLVVALQDGSLLVYPINPAEGGECQLIKQHKLFGETASDLTLGSTAGQSTPDSSACGGPSMSNSDLSSSSGDWTKLKSNASNASSSPQWSPPPRQSYASVVTNSRRSGPQQLKSDGELDLEDAVEDLYLDAETGWLDDNNEFPPVLNRRDR